MPLDDMEAHLTKLLLLLQAAQEEAELCIEKCGECTWRKLASDFRDDD